ncbi:hypothetical protein [Massilia sp. BJB1822]|uniref:hypothetical protein n=1 Tax=Massilia sp. BJB1822 TaxID=2744470 RepID=UPI001593FA21|nr:hypothetical protein [Massilia sp. BJB1822]NVE01762.1 hypothetical protein [Massilia sp. BJB1822]
MKDAHFIGKTLDESIEHFGSLASLYSDGMWPGEDVYLEIPSQGICFIANNKGVIFCIQLFGDGKDETYSTYSGEVYNGIKLSDSREMTRTKLGQPYDSTLGKAEIGDAEHCFYPWDIFSTPKFNIHCEYSHDASRILLVSIQAKSNSMT